MQSYNGCLLNVYSHLCWVGWTKRLSNQTSHVGTAVQVGACNVWSLIYFKGRHCFSLKTLYIFTRHCLIFTIIATPVVFAFASKFTPCWHMWYAYSMSTAVPASRRLAWLQLFKAQQFKFYLVFEGYFLEQHMAFTLSHRSCYKNHHIFLKISYL